MKLCYFDESGTGQEPVAVVVGVVVDSQRMHVTKEHWGRLLSELSGIVGKPLQELHTKDFYVGSGPFRGMAGPARAQYISQIVGWFCARKHQFVHSGVSKAVFERARASGAVPPELKSPWQAAALHCVLSLQRAHQTQEKTKGHTLLVFDNKGHEEGPLADLIADPPAWTDSYYSRSKKQETLSHIVDCPYFAESHRVPMIQVADFLAYFLRRYVELQDGLAPAKYPEEEARIAEWVRTVGTRSLGSNHVYPAKGRCTTAEMFHGLCPPSLRRLEA
jgi:Protein of unknown function (DUF3800)